MSLCVYVYVCVCIYRCTQKFAFSLFGKPNSQAAYLLRKCSDHLTKTRRRTRWNGVSVICVYVCVSSSGYSTTSSIASPSLSNIFLSLSLNILSTILVSILGNQPKQMSFKIISINCSHQQRAYIHTCKHTLTYIHKQAHTQSRLEQYQLFKITTTQSNFSCLCAIELNFIKIQILREPLRML